MSRYDTPEEVYFAFLETFNARDAAGWAGVNSWPHARLSAAEPESFVHWRPPSRVFASAEEYLSAPLWDDLEATSWSYSESTQPRIVQSSEDKAHIAGGWTRFDDRGSAIAANRIVYVAIKTETGWRLQAQLKVDSFVDGHDYAGEEAQVRSAVESDLSLLGAGDTEAYADALAYPFVILGPPGTVTQIGSASKMATAIRSVGDDQLDVPAGSVAIVNCGGSGANVTFRVERSGVTEEALALVGRRGGVWRMLAISGI